MTDHDQAIAEMRLSVEQCEQTHVGQEYPFCENYGCMSMRPLLDEVERLQRLVEKRVTKTEEIQRRHDAVASLAVEISRLRAALREVVAQGHLDACKISVGRCNCAYSDAVEALDPPDPTRPEHSHA